jgi:gliding motility-associated-like protein
VFSPDDDSSNDVWETYLHPGLYPLECQIFDRWGNQCYASKTGELPRWDGYWKGRALPAGVYVWQFRLRNANGKEEGFTGDLLLLR